MITSILSAGVFLAALSRPFATNVPVARALGRAGVVGEPADAVRGMTSAHTRTHAVRNPRPPLPHRTEERESPPRVPVPQSALERSPRSAAPRSFTSDIHSPFPRARRGPQFEPDRPSCRRVDPATWTLWSTGDGRITPT